MSTRVRRFLRGYIPCLLVAVAYLVVAWHESPEPQWFLGTLLSNPALSVYQIAVVPFIGGLLASDVRPLKLVFGAAYARGVLFALTGLLALSGVVLVWSDDQQTLEQRFIEPIEWRSEPVRLSHFRLDQEIRRAKASNEWLCDSVKPRLTQPRDCYDAFLVSVFHKPSVTHAELGIATLWQRLQSILDALLGVGVVAGLLAYHLRAQRDPTVQDGLLAALGLGSLWIPVRIYSDWYIHYRTFDSLPSNSVLLVCGPLILVALLVTAYKGAGGQVPKVFGIVAAVASTATAVLTRLTPELFEGVANVFSCIKLPILIIGELVFILLLYVAVGPPVREPTQPAQPSRANADPT